MFKTLKTSLAFLQDIYLDYIPLEKFQLDIDDSKEMSIRLNDALLDQEIAFLFDPSLVQSLFEIERGEAIPIGLWMMPRKNTSPIRLAKCQNNMNALDIPISICHTQSIQRKINQLRYVIRETEPCLLQFLYQRSVVQSLLHSKFLSKKYFHLPQITTNAHQPLMKKIFSTHAHFDVPATVRISVLTIFPLIEYLSTINEEQYEVLSSRILDILVTTLKSSPFLSLVHEPSDCANVFKDFICKRAISRNFSLKSDQDIQALVALIALAVLRGQATQLCHAVDHLFKIHLHQLTISTMEINSKEFVSILDQPLSQPNGDWLLPVGSLLSQISSYTQNIELALPLVLASENWIVRSLENLEISSSLSPKITTKEKREKVDPNFKTSQDPSHPCHNLIHQSPPNIEASDTPFPPSYGQVNQDEYKENDPDPFSRSQLFPFFKDSVIHSSICSDGHYLYIHSDQGLLKIGSGLDGRVRGHIYASNPDFYPSDAIWSSLICLNNQLYFLSPGSSYDTYKRNHHGTLTDQSASISSTDYTGLSEHDPYPSTSTLASNSPNLVDSWLKHMVLVLSIDTLDLVGEIPLDDSILSQRARLITDGRYIYLIGKKRSSKLPSSSFYGNKPKHSSYHHLRASSLSSNISNNMQTSQIIGDIFESMDEGSSFSITSEDDHLDIGMDVDTGDHSEDEDDQEDEFEEEEESNEDEINPMHHLPPDRLGYLSHISPTFNSNLSLSDTDLSMFNPKMAMDPNLQHDYASLLNNVNGMISSRLLNSTALDNVQSKQNALEDDLFSQSKRKNMDLSIGHKDDNLSSQDQENAQIYMVETFCLRPRHASTTTKKDPVLESLSLSSNQLTNLIASLLGRIKLRWPSSSPSNPSYASTNSAHLNMMLDHSYSTRLSSRFSSWSQPTSHPSMSDITSYRHTDPLIVPDIEIPLTSLDDTLGYHPNEYCPSNGLINPPLQFAHQNPLSNANASLSIFEPTVFEKISFYTNGHHLVAMMYQSPPTSSKTNSLKKMPYQKIGLHTARIFSLEDGQYLADVPLHPKSQEETSIHHQPFGQQPSFPSSEPSNYTNNRFIVPPSNDIQDIQSMDMANMGLASFTFDFYTNCIWAYQRPNHRISLFQNMGTLFYRARHADQEMASNWGIDSNQKIGNDMSMKHLTCYHFGCEFILSYMKMINAQRPSSNGEDYFTVFESIIAILANLDRLARHHLAYYADKSPQPNTRSTEGGHIEEKSPSSLQASFGPTSLKISNDEFLANMVLDESCFFHLYAILIQALEILKLKPTNSILVSYAILTTLRLIKININHQVLFKDQNQPNQTYYASSLNHIRPNDHLNNANVNSFSDSQKVNLLSNLKSLLLQIIEDRSFVSTSSGIADELIFKEASNVITVGLKLFFEKKERIEFIQTCFQKSTSSHAIKLLLHQILFSLASCYDIGDILLPDDPISSTNKMSLTSSLNDSLVIQLLTSLTRSYIDETRSLIHQFFELNNVEFDQDSFIVLDIILPSKFAQLQFFERSICLSSFGQFLLSIQRCITPLVAPQLVTPYLKIMVDMIVPFLHDLESTIFPTWQKKCQQGQSFAEMLISTSSFSMDQKRLFQQYTQRSSNIFNKILQHSILALTFPSFVTAIGRYLSNDKHLISAIFDLLFNMIEALDRLNSKTAMIVKEDRLHPVQSKSSNQPRQKVIFLKPFQSPQPHQPSHSIQKNTTNDSSTFSNPLSSQHCIREHVSLPGASALYLRIHVPCYLCHSLEEFQSYSTRLEAMDIQSKQGSRLHSSQTSKLAQKSPNVPIILLPASYGIKCYSPSGLSSKTLIVPGDKLTLIYNVQSKSSIHSSTSSAQWNRIFKSQKHQTKTLSNIPVHNSDSNLSYCTVTALDSSTIQNLIFNFLDLQASISQLIIQCSAILISGDSISEKERQFQPLIATQILNGGLIDTTMIHHSFPIDHGSKESIQDQFPMDCHLQYQPLSTHAERINWLESFGSGGDLKQLRLYDWIKFQSHQSRPIFQKIAKLKIETAERFVMAALIHHQGMLEDARQINHLITKHGNDNSDVTLKQVVVANELCSKFSALAKKGLEVVTYLAHRAELQKEWLIALGESNPDPSVFDIIRNDPKRLSTLCNMRGVELDVANVDETIKRLFQKLMLDIADLKAMNKVKPFSNQQHQLNAGFLATQSMDFSEKEDQNQQIANALGNPYDIICQPIIDRAKFLFRIVSFASTFQPPYDKIHDSTSNLPKNERLTSSSGCATSMMNEFKEAWPLNPSIDQMDQKSNLSHDHYLGNSSDQDDSSSSSSSSSFNAMNLDHDQLYHLSDSLTYLPSHFPHTRPQRRLQERLKIKAFGERLSELRHWLTTYTCRKTQDVSSCGLDQDLNKISTSTIDPDDGSTITHSSLNTSMESICHFLKMPTLTLSMLVQLEQVLKCQQSRARSRAIGFQYLNRLIENTHSTVVLHQVIGELNISHWISGDHYFDHVETSGQPLAQAIHDAFLKLFQRMVNIIDDTTLSPQCQLLALHLCTMHYHPHDVSILIQSNIIPVLQKILDKKYNFNQENHFPGLPLMPLNQISSTMGEHKLNKKRPANRPHIAMRRKIMVRSSSRDDEQDFYHGLIQEAPEKDDLHRSDHDQFNGHQEAYNAISSLNVSTNGLDYLMQIDGAKFKSNANLDSAAWIAFQALTLQCIHWPQTNNPLVNAHLSSTLKDLILQSLVKELAHLASSMRKFNGKSNEILDDDYLRKQCHEDDLGFQTSVQGDQQHCFEVLSMIYHLQHPNQHQFATAENVYYLLSILHRLPTPRMHRIVLSILRKWLQKWKPGTLTKQVMNGLMTILGKWLLRSKMKQTIESQEKLKINSQDVFSTYNPIHGSSNLTPSSILESGSKHSLTQDCNVVPLPDEPAALYLVSWPHDAKRLFDICIDFASDFFASSSLPYISAELTHSNIQPQHHASPSIFVPIIDSDTIPTHNSLSHIEVQFDHFSCESLAAQILKQVSLQGRALLSVGHYEKIKPFAQILTSFGATLIMTSLKLDHSILFDRNAAQEKFECNVANRRMSSNRAQIWVNGHASLAITSQYIALLRLLSHPIHSSCSSVMIQLIHEHLLVLPELVEQLESVRSSMDFTSDTLSTFGSTTDDPPISTSPFTIHQNDFGSRLKRILASFALVCTFHELVHIGAKVMVKNNISSCPSHLRSQPFVVGSNLSQNVGDHRYATIIDIDDKVMIDKAQLLFDMDYEEVLFNDGQVANPMIDPVHLMSKVVNCIQSVDLESIEAVPAFELSPNLLNKDIIYPLLLALAHLKNLDSSLPTNSDLNLSPKIIKALHINSSQYYWMVMNLKSSILQCLFIMLKHQENIDSFFNHPAVEKLPLLVELAMRKYDQNASIRDIKNQLVQLDEQIWNIQCRPNFINNLFHDCVGDQSIRNDLDLHLNRETFNLEDWILPCSAMDSMLPFLPQSNQIYLAPTSFDTTTSPWITFYGEKVCIAEYIQIKSTPSPRTQSARQETNGSQFSANSAISTSTTQSGHPAHFRRYNVSRGGSHINSRPAENLHRPTLFTTSTNSFNVFDPTSTSISAPHRLHTTSDNSRQHQVYLYRNPPPKDIILLANAAIPLHLLDQYYFEVKIEVADVNAMIGIGIVLQPLNTTSTSTFWPHFTTYLASLPSKLGMNSTKGTSNRNQSATTHLVTWPRNSYHYKSNGSKHYSINDTFKKESYGTSFGLGNVIGCYWSQREQAIYFTKDGKDQGPAFVKVKPKAEQCYLPAVSISRGARVSINFGQFPFVFDIGSMSSVDSSQAQEDQRKKMEEKILNQMKEEEMRIQRDKEKEDVARLELMEPILNMGYNIKQAHKAMEITGWNSAEVAVHWLIENPNYEFENVASSTASSNVIFPDVNQLDTSRLDRLRQEEEEEEEEDHFYKQEYKSFQDHVQDQDFDQMDGNELSDATNSSLAPDGDDLDRKEDENQDETTINHLQFSPLDDQLFLDEHDSSSSLNSLDFPSNNTSNEKDILPKSTSMDTSCDPLSEPIESNPSSHISTLGDDHFQLPQPSSHSSHSSSRRLANSKSHLASAKDSCLKYNHKRVLDFILSNCYEHVPGFDHSQFRDHISSIAKQEQRNLMTQEWDNVIELQIKNFMEKDRFTQFEITEYLQQIKNQLFANNEYTTCEIVAKILGDLNHFNYLPSSSKISNSRLAIAASATKLKLNDIKIGQVLQVANIESLDLIDGEEKQCGCCIDLNHNSFHHHLIGRYGTVQGYHIGKKLVLMAFENTDESTFEIHCLPLVYLSKPHPNLNLSNTSSPIASNETMAVDLMSSQTQLFEQLMTHYARSVVLILSQHHSLTLLISPSNPNLKSKQLSMSSISLSRPSNIENNTLEPFISLEQFLQLSANEYLRDIKYFISSLEDESIMQSILATCPISKFQLDSTKIQSLSTTCSDSKPNAINLNSQAQLEPAEGIVIIARKLFMLLYGKCYSNSATLPSSGYLPSPPIKSSDSTPSHDTRSPISSLVSYALRLLKESCQFIASQTIHFHFHDGKLNVYPPGLVRLSSPNASPIPTDFNPSQPSPSIPLGDIGAGSENKELKDDKERLDYFFEVKQASLMAIVFKKTTQFFSDTTIKVYSDENCTNLIMYYSPSTFLTPLVVLDNKVCISFKGKKPNPSKDITFSSTRAISLNTKQSISPIDLHSPSALSKFVAHAARAHNDIFHFAVVPVSLDFSLACWIISFLLDVVLTQATTNREELPWITDLFHTIINSIYQLHVPSPFKESLLTLLSRLCRVYRIYSRSIQSTIGSHDSLKLSPGIDQMNLCLDWSMFNRLHREMKTIYDEELGKYTIYSQYLQILIETIVDIKKLKMEQSIQYLTKYNQSLMTSCHDHSRIDFSSDQYMQIAIELASSINESIIQNNKHQSDQVENEDLVADNDIMDIIDQDPELMKALALSIQNDDHLNPYPSSSHSLDINSSPTVTETDQFNAGSSSQQDEMASMNLSSNESNPDLANIQPHPNFNHQKTKAKSRRYLSSQRIASKSKSSADASMKDPNDHLDSTRIVEKVFNTFSSNDTLSKLPPFVLTNLSYDDHVDWLKPIVVLSQTFELFCNRHIGDPWQDYMLLYLVQKANVTASSQEWIFDRLIVVENIPIVPMAKANDLSLSILELFELFDICLSLNMIYIPICDVTQCTKPYAIIEIQTLEKVALVMSNMNNFEWVTTELRAIQELNQAPKSIRITKLSSLIKTADNNQYPAQETNPNPSRRGMAKHQSSSNQRDMNQSIDTMVQDSSTRLISDDHRDPNSYLNPLLSYVASVFPLDSCTSNMDSKLVDYFRSKLIKPLNGELTPKFKEALSHIFVQFSSNHTIEGVIMKQQLDAMQLIMSGRTASIETMMYLKSNFEFKTCPSVQDNHPNRTSVETDSPDLHSNPSYPDPDLNFEGLSFNGFTECYRLQACIEPIETWIELLSLGYDLHVHPTLFLTLDDAFDAFLNHGLLLDQIDTELVSYASQICTDYEIPTSLQLTISHFESIPHDSYLAQCFPNLVNLSMPFIGLRWIMLQQFNTHIMQSLPLVKLEKPDISISSLDNLSSSISSISSQPYPFDLNLIPRKFSHNFSQYRHLMFHSVKMSFFHHILDLTSVSILKQPIVSIDRFKLAARKEGHHKTTTTLSHSSHPLSTFQLGPVSDSSPPHPSISTLPTLPHSLEESRLLKNTLFGIAFTQLFQVNHQAFRQRRPPGTEPHFSIKIDFKNENVEGDGGPYRQFFTDISKELMFFSPLFVQCPNAQAKVGRNQDKFVIAPSTQTSPLYLEMYHFIGQLMGIAIRTGVMLTVDFPSFFWKPLVGQILTVSDLRDIDYSFCKFLRYLANCQPNELHGSQRHIFQRFQVLRSDRSSVPLLRTRRETGIEPGKGSYSDGEEVTYANRLAYIEMAAFTRLKESNIQIQAIQNGIGNILSLPLLQLLTWQDLERRTCGLPNIDVNLLKRHTEYSMVSPNEDHIRYFWMVMHEFSQQDRRAFVRFAWAQERLPADDQEFGRTQTRMLIKPFSYGETNQDLIQYHPDKMFPKADTCFFNLMLPEYSSPEILRERLLFAIHTDADSMDADDPHEDL